MEQNLDSLKLRETAKVINIVTKDNNLLKKLTAMGILKGTIITVIKKAFFGDPIEVKIRGYCLSLRKEEASAVKMEVLK